MTHQSHSNQSVFSLALASRGLAPTRIVRESENLVPRPSTFEPMEGWFLALALALFAFAGLGAFLPIA